MARSLLLVALPLSHALLAPPTAGNVTSAARLAMCRVLLPDYACWGFELPLDCLSIIGKEALADACPATLQAAIKGASRRRSARR